MKLLAMEREVPGVDESQCEPYLWEEAGKVWELYQSGILREIYFRTDRDAAVLVMESSRREEAEQVLESLPLVREGLITFEVIPLSPYPGFERLFAHRESGG